MKFFIGANLKMNKTYSELEKYNLELENKFKKLENIKLMISPNFTGLSIFSKNKNISLWAQNISSENSWAFTWEISAEMLKDLNCKYVILWHSEVRKNLWEDSELINKKAKIVLEKNLIPIICISDKKQFQQIEKNILKSEIIIAYEPLSAVSTGNTASTSEIQNFINFIKNNIDNKETRIIYWWSVNSKNSEKISQIKNLDWFLIWWACLQVDDLLEIVNTIK